MQVDADCDSGRCVTDEHHFLCTKYGLPNEHVLHITHYFFSHFLNRYFTFLLLCEIPVMLTHIQYDSSFSIYFLALRDWHVLQMDWTIAW